MITVRHCLLAVLLSATHAPAQDAPAPAEDTSSVAPLLQAVREDLAAEQWLDATRSFDLAWQQLCASEDQSPEVRLSGDDRLLPGSSRFNAGMKARMRQVYRMAPEVFHTEFQRQFNPAATAALRSAVRRRAESELRILIQQHEFCDSATAALWLLATWEHAGGDFLKAALTLSQLVTRSVKQNPSAALLLAECWSRAGFTSEARHTILRLCEHYGFATAVSIHGTNITLPCDASDVGSWVSRHFATRTSAASHSWQQPLGNAGRSEPHHTTGATLKELWRSSLYYSAAWPKLNRPLAEIERRLAQETPASSIGPVSPLVHGDLVVVQAAGSLQAIDRRTGTLQWESRNFNRQLKTALESNSPESVVSRIILESPGNHTRGQMCTDGRLLFCVEETTQGGDRGLRVDRPALVDVNYNLLRVYDLKTGEMRGQAGGLVPQTGPGQTDPLSGIYFLGAPLLIADRILVLAEDGQGIHLLDLRLRPRTDAGIEELEFRIADRQLISVPRFDLATHPVRRYAGITPSFGHGLIICHASDELVCGVSAVDLSIQWIHRYRSNVDGMDLDGRVPVVGNAVSSLASRRNDLLQRPHDSIARIAGRYVLLMPRDSGQLICLDVRSGNQVWTLPRGGMKYFAALSDDAVVVAGGPEIVSIVLNDGQPSWRRELQGDEVSGQPAWTHRLVHVPTSQGRIVTFAVSSGRRLLSESLTNAPVGNLLSLPGQLMAQSQSRLICWREVPPEKLPDPGIAEIRRALLEDEPDSLIPELAQLVSDVGSAASGRAAQELLTDLLLESLRLDFNRYRHQIPELRRLIAERSVDLEALADFLRHTLGMTLHDAAELPLHWKKFQQHRHQRDRLDQLIVRGLRSATDQPIGETAEQIALVVGNVLQRPGRIVADGRIQMRASGSAAAGINEALNCLDDAERDHVIQQTGPAIRSALEQSTSELMTLRLIRFCFMAGLSDCLLSADKLPIWNLSGVMRRIVIGRLLASRDSQLRNPGAVPGKVDRLLISAAGFSAEDWPSPDQFAEAARNDRLGTLMELLRNNRDQRSDEAATLIRPPRVIVGEARNATRGQNPVAGAPARLMSLRGFPGAWRGWRFSRVHQQNDILALDDHGDIRWRFDLPTRPEAVNRSYGRDSREYAVACGSLLAIHVDQFIHMLNPMELADGQSRRLWTLDLQSTLAPPSQTQQYVPGWQRTTIYDQQPDGLGPMGPLTEFALPVFRGRRLVVIDPWTGDLIWTLTSLPDDCRLAAERDLLCVISESAGQVEVRDLRDGRVVRSGTLPSWWTVGNDMYDSSVRHIEREEGTEIPWRIIVEGTCCVVFRLSHDRSTLTGFELTQTGPDRMNVTWELPLPADTVFSNAVNGIVALLSEAAKLRVVRIADGKVLAEHDVTPAPECDRLYLRESHGRLIVLTHIADLDPDQVPIMQAVPVSGPVYCFDAQSLAPVWTGSAHREYLRILNPERSPTLPVAPLLIMLRRISHERPGSPLRGSDYAVRILDVENGETLYEETGLGTSLSWHALRFDGNRQFTVIFDLRDVTFDFSGEGQ